MSTKNIPSGNTAGTFAAGNDPRFSDITNKAANGANADITSLSGLTTALSVGQGGTGSTTQNFVDLSSAQSIAGTKTFVTNPLVPTPTASGHVATKSYVDTTIAANVTDATTASKGIIQLAGDLGGTATAPYVLGGGVLTYNYVFNPGFESDYSNWSTYGSYGTISRTNTTAAFGSFSSQQVNTVAQDGGLISSGLTLQPGTYTLSFYMAISSDVTNASVIVQGAVSGVILSFHKAYASVADGSWTQYNGTFSLSSTQSVTLLVGMGSYGVKSTGTVYYDAFSIQTGSGNYTYFDGNTNGSSNITYAWTGNANQSQSTKQARVRLQSTDQLAEGTNNLYFTTARAWTNPTFTGTVTVPTPTTTTSATTKAYVDASQASLSGINTQAANYTFVLSDAGKQVEYTASSAGTFTIPLNASVAFPVGTIVQLYLGGTGAVTVSIATGGTLVSAAGYRLATQYASATLIQRAANFWVLSGNTAV